MIEYPWIIVHQPGGEKGKIETLLAGPATATHVEFGIIICDVIRHVARANGVKSSDVFNIVEKEFNNPTSSLNKDFYDA